MALVASEHLLLIGESFPIYNVVSISINAGLFHDNNSHAYEDDCFITSDVMDIILDVYFDVSIQDIFKNHFARSVQRKTACYKINGNSDYHQ
jgi:hypothetical protein